MFNRNRLILLIIFPFLFSGCAQKGLLLQKYDADSYRVEKLLPNDVSQKNPIFIVYGDTQSSWRVQHKFIASENWLTLKMLIFPVYETIWLGNGIIGTFNRIRLHPDIGRKLRLFMRQQKRNLRNMVHYGRKQAGTQKST